MSVGSFDFQIYQPKAVDDDYEETLKYNLRKISKLVRVHRVEITIDDGFDVVKVELGLPSAGGPRQDKPMDMAVRGLCEKMISVEKRCYLSCLTESHIWGIKPLSPMFNAFWTSCFFDDVLKQSKDLTNDLLQNAFDDAKPYIVPTVLVFGFAVLTGLKGCFQLMDAIKGVRTVADLTIVVESSFEPIRMLFEKLGRNRTASLSLKDREKAFEAKMLFFKGAYDELLAELDDAGVGVKERDASALTRVASDFLKAGPRLYAICSKLCEMSVAASQLVILRKDLLESLVAAKANAIEGSFIWGFTSVANIGGIAAQVIKGASAAVSSPIAFAGTNAVLAAVAV